MYENICILVSSPKNEQSNSNNISKNIEKKLINKHLNYSKLYLSKEINDMESLMKKISKSDLLLLILPIYENNVPSTVLYAFEELYKRKKHIFQNDKSLFVITSSGYASMDASKYAVNTCQLFADSMNITWLGSISAVPGTLIEGEDLGKMYNNFSKALDIITDSFSQNIPISQSAFSLASKPVIPSFLYRFAGKLYQSKSIKEIGKSNFFAKPLI